MTENETIREMTFEEEYEILQKEKEELFAMEICDSEPPFANCVVRRALRCIKKLLEEIQQYRVIGTVEDIRNTHLLCEVFSNTVRDYTTIGTIEEFKALKYKSEPKKPIRKPNADWTHEEVTCPNCSSYISEYTNRKYCDCGQKLDW